MDERKNPKLCLSQLLLRRQMDELTRKPSQNFSVGLVDDDNVYRWRVMIIGQNDTIHEGAFYQAQIDFPLDYPGRPPHVFFISDMWHPNIDRWGYVYLPMLTESAYQCTTFEDATFDGTDRWLPVHSAETIIEAIVKLLCNPNLRSPANLEATMQFRNQLTDYKRRVRRFVRKSQDMVYD